MDTDIQLHNAVNSFSVAGDARNIQGLLQTASTECGVYKRPIQNIEVSATSVEGHVEINFSFAAETEKQREVQRLAAGGSSTPRRIRMAHTATLLKSPALKQKPGSTFEIKERQKTMNAPGNIEQEYDSYLSRFEQFRPGEEPLHFDAFVQAYERWDKEYDAAVRDGDYGRLRELEQLMCV